MQLLEARNGGKDSTVNSYCQVNILRKDQKIKMKMKWQCFKPLFLHCEGWIGPGTAWANEVKFLWNLFQSSIDPSTLDSESNALPLNHGGPLRTDQAEFLLNRT